MIYEQFIHSKKPIWFSGIALAILSLLPISVLVFSGWHSGVPWAAFFAVQWAVLIPGIYLLRPLVFWLWMAVAITLSVSGICTIEYYWRSAPDWMDADIPKAVSYSIKSSVWLILSSSVVLGVLGWMTYFGRRHISRPR